MPAYTSKQHPRPGDGRDPLRMWIPAFAGVMKPVSLLWDEKNL